MAHARRRHAYQAPSWLGLLIWTLIFTAIFWLAASAPAYPAIDRVDATQRPTCSTGKPLTLWLMNESSATDCDATAGGSTPALCCCDGDASPAWAACASAGASGNSFSTIDAPSGTDPVADSSTDTLQLLSGAAALSVTGSSLADSVTFDIAGTASKCARFDGSGELVAASGDCSAGDTTGTSVSLDLQADGGSDSTAISQVEARNNYEGWGLAEPTADVATFDAKGATDQALAFKPGSADTPDDEFNSGTLDAKWTIRAAYTGCAAGTVNLLETGDVEEYDLTTQPGWLLVAAGSTTSYGCGFMQTYTIPDGKSVILKAAMSQIPPTNNGHQYGVNLCDDSSCTNYIQLFVDQELNAQRVVYQEVGTATGTGSNVYVDAAFFYLRIARDGLNYFGFVSTNGVTWSNLGWFTTGAAWGYVELMSNVSGAHSSTMTVPISAFDWFRLGTNDLNPW